MIEFRILILAGLISCLLTVPAQAERPEWRPISPPAELEGPIRVLMIAVDDSGSMGEGPALSPRARAAGRHAVAGVDPCTYVVIGSFGSTAQVLTDRFACTEHDRQVLADAIEIVPMTASHTDVRVLERLLWVLLDALNDAFGPRGFHVEVQILSDGEADPVDQEERQSFELILGKKATRTELGGGLYLFGLNLDRSIPVVQKAMPATTPPEAILRERIGASVDEAPSGKPTAVILVAGGVSLLALAGFLAVRRRVQRDAREALERPACDPESNVAPIKSPVGIQVTEWQVSDQGERMLVREAQAVQYKPGVPITLGRDANRVLVGLRTPGLPARLASITLDGRGEGVVTPLNGGFDFDEEAITRPIRFAAEHPHVIKVESTELQIEPVDTLPDSETVLYRRLCNRTQRRPRGDADDDPPQAKGTA